MPGGITIDPKPEPLSNRELADTAAMLDVLTRARARIADRSRWLKGMHACDSQGVMVPSESPTAVRWGITGAIRAEVSAHPAVVGVSVIAHPLFWDTLAAVRWAAYCHDGSYTVPDFNDRRSTGHGEVLAVLDSAIAIVAEIHVGG